MLQFVIKIKLNKVCTQHNPLLLQQIKINFTHNLEVDSVLEASTAIVVFFNHESLRGKHWNVIFDFL